MLQGIFFLMIMQVTFHTGCQSDLHKGLEKINKIYLHSKYAPIIRRFIIICVSNWHLSRTISLHSRAKYLAAAFEVSNVNLKCSILESTPPHWWTTSTLRVPENVHQTYANPLFRHSRGSYIFLYISKLLHVNTFLNDMDARDPHCSLRVSRTHWRGEMAISLFHIDLRSKRTYICPSILNLADLSKRPSKKHKPEPSPLKPEFWWIFKKKLKSLSACGRFVIEEQ
jgi:hypothetical protein